MSGEIIISIDHGYKLIVSKPDDQGDIYVRYENDFGNTLERVYIFQCLSDNEEGVDAVLALRDYENIRRVLDTISAEFFEFYAGLMRLESVGEGVYVDCLNSVISRALGSLDMFKGEEDAVYVVKEYVIAYCMNFAREQLLEGLRVTHPTESEFYADLVRYSDILYYESTLASKSNQLNVIYFPYHELFLASWLFYDSRKICTLEYCAHKGERAFLSDLLRERRGVSLYAKFQHSKLATAYSTDPFSRTMRFAGLPGSGKTSTAKLLKRVYPDSKYLEGSKDIEGSLVQRIELFLRTESLRCRLESATSCSTNQVDRSHTSYGKVEISSDLSIIMMELDLSRAAYWGDRMAVIPRLKLEEIDAMRKQQHIIVDSMPMLPVVARLADLSVNELFERDYGDSHLKRQLLGEMFYDSCINPERYYPVRMGMIGSSLANLTLQCVLGRLVKEEALVNSSGYTVFIDILPRMCFDRVRRAKVGSVGTAFRLLDFESWGSWRLIYTILADVFPFIGHVRGCLPNGNSLGKLQIALLSLSTLRFFKIKAIASTLNSTDIKIDHRGEISRILGSLRSDIKSLYKQGSD